MCIENYLVNGVNFAVNGDKCAVNYGQCVVNGYTFSVYSDKYALN